YGGTMLLTLNSRLTHQSGEEPNAGQIFYGFEELSRNAFATADSGATWVENPAPPANNGRVIFAGDNGVVPGLQGP
uniref:hypothetical protein n=3 Tax=Thiolapillus sp. TaxID=2017437 RepID=UPI003AF4EFF1